MQEFFYAAEKAGNVLGDALMTDPSVMTKYSDHKGALQRCIDEIIALDRVPGVALKELRDKLKSEAFHLLVVGQFKRGKTSLVNALLGADLLPVAVVPLTSIVTILTYGETLRIEVHFQDGRRAEIGAERLTEFVTEKGNPRNVKQVGEVVIAYPSPYLTGGVRLIDTPGVGSIYQHNTDVAYRYLPKADAALFLLSVDQPLGRAELDFLNDVKEYAHKIFFLLNKADYLAEEELKESIEFSTTTLQEVMGPGVRIFPVSAKLALEGRQGGSEELLQRSLLPAFTAALDGFLMDEKGAVLLLSVTRALLRMLSQAKLEAELELTSLALPLAELEEKTRAFEAKTAEVLRERQDFDLLLEGDTKRLLESTLDEDVMKFRKDLIDRERAHLQEQYSRMKKLSSRQLRHTLERLVMERVRAAFSEWRAVEDDRLAKEFEVVCRRFADKINDTTDNLVKFSAQLFACAYEPFRTDVLARVPTRFTYKFRDQPVGIEIIASSLTLALPRWIGNRRILKDADAFLTKAIDMQTARLSYDFSERVQKSKLGFKREMLQALDATLEGIAGAIRKAAAQRSQGAEEVARRRKELVAGAHSVEALQQRLIRIQSDLGG